MNAKEIHRKSCHWGLTTKVEKSSEGKASLLVDSFDADTMLEIVDSEVVEDITSPEVVHVTVTAFFDDDEAKELAAISIHKKDCLHIASFLLNIYTDYAKKVEGLDFQDFLAQEAKAIEQQKACR
jgi:hypothetical protein